MRISVESEDLSHAAMRPPASHRRPAGARSGSGQVTETPRVAWRPMTPLALRDLSTIKDGLISTFRATTARCGPDQPSPSGGARSTCARMSTGSARSATI